MLDQSVLTRVREYIAAELRPRDQSFGLSLRQKQLQLAPTQGALSGAVAYAHIELGKAELEVRAGLIWGVIQRSYTSLVGRDAPGLTEDLQQQIAEYLTEEARTVSEMASQAWRDNNQIFALVRDPINVERRNELRRRFDIEVQFYVDALHKPSPAVAEAPIMNFNAPVGAVQTGTHATATVSFSSDGGQRLIDAIEALRNSIETNREMSVEGRANSVEIVTDLVVAAKAEKPNSAKIRGLLNGLAQTVQTIPSIQPAWHVVKDAAAAIGAWIS
jgi:hypothetical protein